MANDPLAAVEQALLEAQGLARDEEQHASRAGQLQRARWYRQEQERVAELLHEIRELRAAAAPPPDP